MLVETVVPQVDFGVQTYVTSAVGPAWARLSSQPSIDWAHEGTRGDCVVSDWEYIKTKYCTRQTVLPHAMEWPTEERLSMADTLARRLPQGSMLQLVRRAVCDFAATVAPPPGVAPTTVL